MDTIGDLAEGQRLRDEGMALVTRWSDERCIFAVDSMIAALNRNGREWSANTLRRMIAYVWPEIPDAKPGLIGARVRAAAMRKEMVRVSYTPSTLPSTHAHPISVWKGI